MNEEIKNNEDKTTNDHGIPWGLYGILFSSVAVFIAICIQAYLDNHH